MAELVDCPQCGRPMASWQPVCDRCRREAMKTELVPRKRRWRDRLKRKKH
jgi:hypothetical protein